MEKKMSQSADIQPEITGCEKCELVIVQSWWVSELVSWWLHYCCKCCVDEWSNEVLIGISIAERAIQFGIDCRERFSLVLIAESDSVWYWLQRAIQFGIDCRERFSLYRLQRAIQFGIDCRERFSLVLVAESDSVWYWLQRAIQFGIDCREQFNSV